MRIDTKIGDIEFLNIFGEELAEAGYLTIEDILLGGVEKLVFAVHHKISILTALVATVLEHNLGNKEFLGEHYQNFDNLSHEEQKTYVSNLVTEIYKKKLASLSIHAVVEALDLNASAYNTLKRSGYNTVKDILDKGLDKLIAARGMTGTILEEILVILSKTYNLTPFINDYFHSNSGSAVVNGVDIEPMLRRTILNARIALSRFDSISKLRMSNGLRECLTKYGIVNLWRFLELPERERILIRGIGPYLLEFETLVNGLENDTNEEFRLMSDEEEESVLGQMMDQNQELEDMPAFHIWIEKSAYFTRARLVRDNSDWMSYRACSGYRAIHQETEIVWEHYGGAGETAYYPVMVKCTDSGEICFDNINPGVKRRHNIGSFTESVDKYVLHNNSFASVKVHGFEEVPPGSILSFSEADYCGEHWDGFSVIGHGTVISAPEGTVFSRFLEKPGVIEKATDRIWHFYTDKGHGGFGKGDFSITSVTRYEMKGNLLTCVLDILDDERIIRILLDTDMR